jgi:hypothetical protein
MNAHYLRYKKYYENYYPKHKKQVKLYMQSLKILVLQIYSNGTMKCANCGFDNIDALSIDHINNDGCKQRKKIKREGGSFYQWLKTNNFPVGYQVLCMNCQIIKRNNGGKFDC